MRIGLRAPRPAVVVEGRVALVQRRRRWWGRPVLPVDAERNPTMVSARLGGKQRLHRLHRAGEGFPEPCEAKPHWLRSSQMP